MTGTRPRYTRIEQLTDALLVAAGVSAPPVRVEEIVQAQGIAIR